MWKLFDENYDDYDNYQKIEKWNFMCSSIRAWQIITSRWGWQIIPKLPPYTWILTFEFWPSHFNLRISASKFDFEIMTFQFWPLNFDSELKFWTLALKFRLLIFHYPVLTVIFWPSIFHPNSTNIFAFRNFALKFAVFLIVISSK